MTDVLVKIWLIAACFAGARMCFSCSSASAQPAAFVATNLLQINFIAEQRQRMTVKMRLEADVLFVNSAMDRIALQDESGTLLMNMQLPASFRLEAGERILLKGHYGIEGFAASPAVVENDGLHGMDRKQFGQIFLTAGKHPFRVDWFNGTAQYGLEVHYTGPGIPWQIVPAIEFYRTVTNAADGTVHWFNGLDYSCYEGRGTWDRLPDYSKRKPVKTGVTASFDCNLLTRKTNAGMEYRGYLETLTNGLYTFSLHSDDGSRLYLDENVDPLRVQILATNLWPTPRKLVPGQVLSSDDEGGWAQMDGTVTFAGVSSDGAQLELKSPTGHATVYVVGSSEGAAAMLLNSRARITGFCPAAQTVDGLRTAGMLLVPDFKQIQLLELPDAQWTRHPLITAAELVAGFSAGRPAAVAHLSGRIFCDSRGGRFFFQDKSGMLPVEIGSSDPWPTNKAVEILGFPVHAGTNVSLACGVCRPLIEETNASWSLPLLTTAEEVKSLSYEQANRKYPVRIRGVITERSFPSSVIQDFSGGIYWNQMAIPPILMPRVGDYCEVDGSTISAHTAPGIVAKDLIILTPGSLPEPAHPSWSELNSGSLDCLYVEIQGVITQTHTNLAVLLTPGGVLDVFFPMTEARPWTNMVGAVVRLRGCLNTHFDKNHQVIPGEIMLRAGSVAVDSPAPADPFDVPAKRVSELRYFDVNAGALQRVKVSGQVIGRVGGTYFLMQEGAGLRFVPQLPLNLEPGERVEIVGFPDLSGPSPVLREAVVRPLGKDRLPDPLLLTEGTLTESTHDATRVEIDSHLVSLRERQSEVLFELQAGTQTYWARLAGSTDGVSKIPLGSLVAVTGVYASHGTEGMDGGDTFELVLNSPGDIRLVARPSWWTTGRAVAVAGGLAVVLLMATLWIRALRIRVEQQTRQLRKEIEERKEAELKVEQIHKELLATSRQAGMADVATNVLHNVGNVLNSVNVSANLAFTRLKESKISNLNQAADLLRRNEPNIGDFMANDPKGKQLATYLVGLADHLTKERSAVLQEISLLQENIGHIKNIVSMQQNYARACGVNEQMPAADLVEDALRMNAGAFGRDGIVVQKDYGPNLPQMTVDKHKALQILINLFRNAKYACAESGRASKVIRVGITAANGRVRIVVADNGIGIAPENTTRIFNHGFTTRKDGHGFGLHSGAIAAKEMGGALTAFSEGIGHGAIFTLELPVKPPSKPARMPQTLTNSRPL